MSSFTLTANPDSITGTDSTDTITTTNANFAAGDIINADAGGDTLSFTDRATISAASLASKTGIDAIRFSVSGNTAVISDAFVDASDADSVELTNGATTISSLDTSGVSALHNVVIGGTGAVTLSGTGDNRVLAKDGVNTSILGGAGNDTILGGTGNDRLNGGSGNDSLSSGGGNDNINGGAGNDTIAVADATFNSSDTIVGGAGTDTLVFTTAAAISNTDLANVSGVETLGFEADGNTIVLTQANLLNAGSTLELNNGTHTITSLNTAAVRSTESVIIGGTGAVTLANAANNRITAKDGVNTAINGGTGNDTILGGTGNDLFSAGRGNDSINAGAGNDTLTTYDADINTSDRFSGGSGIDTLRFMDKATISTTDLAHVDGFEIIEFTVDVNTVTLNDSIVVNAGGSLEIDNNGFTVTSLNTAAVNSSHNVVIGGTGAVTLANSANNRITAKDGVNTSIIGGSGNDTIIGGTGNDILTGGTGNDSINAGAGNDTIIASTGTNTLNGGDGVDVLRYTAAATITSTSLDNVSAIEVIEFTTNGNSVILSDTAVTNAGGTLELQNSGFTITSLDTSAVTSAHNVLINGTGTVTLANNANNRITAKDGVNTSIIGGTGSDTIIGGTGNDYISAGTGSDSISGDSGNDTIAAANLDSTDTVAGGTGTDSLVFTGAATLTTDVLAHVSGIEEFLFTADGNTVTLNDTVLALGDTPGTITLNNGAFTITSLDTSAVTNHSGVIVSGTGTVTLANNAGNSVVAKDGVNTSIIGGSGNDTITGGTGNDTFNGGTGNDSINAGAGNDVIVSTNAAFDANDTISGGAGTDTLSFTDAATITAAKLANVSSVEVLQFGANGNSITLTDTYVDSLDNDKLELNNGAFSITSLDTSAVNEDRTVVIGGTGAVTLANGVNNAITTKDGVNTSIIGGTGNDTIISGTGADSLHGGAGDDTFINITSNDTVIGGDGVDSLIFTEGATLDSSVLSHVSGIEKIYLASSITNFTLTEAFVDSALNETVELHNGTYTVIDLDSSAVHSAVVITGTGMVTLADGIGNSVTAMDGVNTNIVGGTGNDTIFSGTGNDSLSGDGGSDTFVDISANDTVDGGSDSGTDTLRFTTTAAITPALFENVSHIEVIEFGASGNTVEINDVMASSSDTGSIELGNGAFTITSLHTAAVNSTHSVVIGGTGAVTLADSTGNRVVAKDGVNTSIIGGSGNDTIVGGTGNDTMSGGTGSDLLSGGTGNDTFIDVAAGDTVSGGDGTDTISYSAVATITSGTFANITGIEAIAFNADGNSVTLTDAVVAASSSGNLELNNGTHTITSLDSSAVASSHNVVISGTGAVSLADNIGNRIIAKDGINTSVIGGTGNDSFAGGTGNDSFAGGAGSDSFQNLSAGDTISGGTGTDTLVFTQATTLTASSLANVSGVEVIQLGISGNTIALSDSTVANSDTGSLEIANGNYTLTLDTSAVLSGHSVVIGGTGAVTLADNAGNAVTSKDGVNTSIISGSGNDSFVGGTGSDSLAGGAGNDSFSAINSSDTVDGGTGSDIVTFTSATASTALAHVSGVETIAFGADGNSLILTDTMVNSTTAGSIELANSTHTITSLDTSAVVSGHSVVIGGTGAVTLADNAGNRITAKDAVNTSIIGGTGNDSFTGGTGSDNFAGGAGNDSFYNIGATDTVDGGTGIDSLAFTQAASITASSFTNVSNIDALVFGADGNTVVVTDDMLTTLGTSVLTLSNGAFTVSSLDTSAVNNNNSVVIVGTGAVTLANNTGNRVTTTNGVNTSIIGGTGDDTVINLSGSDSISGGEGNDTINGLNAGDTVSGGDGVDMLVFNSAVTLTSGAFASVSGIESIQLNADGNSLALSSGFVTSADGGYVEIANDHFTVTSLDTSAAPLGYDVIITGTGAVTLANSAGNRVIASDDIDASITGGSGNDTIIGGVGADSLSGGAGNDSISSGSGADVISTTEANLNTSDSINGGAGNDTLLFTDSAAISITDLTNVRNVETIAFSANGNTVALKDANVSNAGGTLHLANDSFTLTSLDTSMVGSARHVVIEGTGAVTLASNAGNHVYAGDGIDSSIIGGSGNDTVIGGSGNDHIAGGAGKDYLTGNNGNDNFIFTTLTDSTSNASDVITDFVRGNDLIVLTGMGFTGIQSGTASGTVLGYSNDGASTVITNAAGTFHITLTGVYATLDGTDIVFA